jgi:hypothetical protein
LTIASSDRLIQQSNGVITREVEATHRLRRGIIVTSDDCIAIETDEVFVLRVHRRSANPFLQSMFLDRAHHPRGAQTDTQVSCVAVGRPQASDDSLKGAGRHHHSKSNSATQAGPTPAMATVMTAVAAFSALRRIAPRPSNDPPIFM